jgi:hypothetical protein
VAASLGIMALVAGADGAHRVAERGRAEKVHKVREGGNARVLESAIAVQPPAHAQQSAFDPYVAAARQSKDARGTHALTALLRTFAAGPMRCIAARAAAAQSRASATKQLYTSGVHRRSH